MRPLLISLLAVCVCAADPVGVWRHGDGRIDGAPGAPGDRVLTGQTIVAGDAGPLRLASESDGITVIFAAGSAGSFAVETAADGRRLLVMHLQQGAVQFDVVDQRPYAGVRVRGAALDVAVTGTLFVVERVRRDADYVALVRGKVKVGLRPEIAKALGRGEGEELELLERQGVSGDTVSGLGVPVGLDTRPQIHLAAGVRRPISEPPADARGGWDRDLAANLTAGNLDDTLDDGPSLFSSVAEDLADSLAELGAAPQAVSDQMSEGAAPSGGGAGALPLPPPPPPGP